MIKTKELRIGNIVKDEHGIIQFVYQIYNDSVELSSDLLGNDDLDYSEDEIFGVEITVELLEKIGFVHDGYGFYELDKIRKSLIICPNEDNLCLYRSDVGMSYYDVGDADYLHELQNLYFTLFKEELIDEKSILSL